tara:strand:- start:25 stop:237 length:213 start_codon:yes stop_codon:yes gene_type:complete
MIQGMMIKKLAGMIFKLVMKQLMKQFDLEGIQKYVKEPNELDKDVKFLKKENKALRKEMKKVLKLVDKLL